MSTYNPNDQAANTNQRAPGLSLPGKYPYVDFWQGRQGNWWRTDDTPGNEHHARGHVSGTYQEQTPLEGTTALTVNNHHHYVGGGSTTTSDANHDFKLGGSHVMRMLMDLYSEHGADFMHAIGGDIIHANKGISYTHATGGTQISSSGDHVTDHNDGNHHHNVAGDHVSYIGGVRYESVDGDKGTYVPNGNMDIHVSNNFNVLSDTQITIKVGNSIITVLPQSVVIQDGNGNQVGMNQSEMWVAPSGSLNVYLGGNGSTGSYAPVNTTSGPCINVLGRYA